MTSHASTTKMHDGIPSTFTGPGPPAQLAVNIPGDQRASTPKPAESDHKSERDCLALGALLSCSHATGEIRAPDISHGANSLVIHSPPTKHLTGAPIWTLAEDSLLLELVLQLGPGRWAEVARRIQERLPRAHPFLQRDPRERWRNHIDPSLNKGPWCPEEDRILLETRAQLGNKWASIARRLPGRSENATKNRYHALQRRKTVLLCHLDGTSSFLCHKPRACRAVSDDGTESCSASDSEKSDPETLEGHEGDGCQVVTPLGNDVSKCNEEEPCRAARPSATVLSQSKTLTHIPRSALRANLTVPEKPREGRSPMTSRSMTSLPASVKRQKSRPPTSSKSMRPLEQFCAEIEDPTILCPYVHSPSFHLLPSEPLPSCIVAGLQQGASAVTKLESEISPSSSPKRRIRFADSTTISTCLPDSSGGGRTSDVMSTTLASPQKRCNDTAGGDGSRCASSSDPSNNNDAPTHELPTKSAIWAAMEAMVPIQEPSSAESSSSEGTHYHHRVGEKEAESSAESETDNSIEPQTKVDKSQEVKKQQGMLRHAGRAKTSPGVSFEMVKQSDSLTNDTLPTATDPLICHQAMRGSRRKRTWHPGSPAPLYDGNSVDDSSSDDSALGDINKNSFLNEYLSTSARDDKTNAAMRGQRRHDTVLQQHPMVPPSSPIEKARGRRKIARRRPFMIPSQNIPSVCLQLLQPTEPAAKDHVSHQSTCGSCRNGITCHLAVHHYATASIHSVLLPDTRRKVMCGTNALSQRSSSSSSMVILKKRQRGMRRDPSVAATIRTDEDIEIKLESL